MEIAGLAPVGNAADVIDGAVVPGLHLVGIFDHLVNEVAEMKDEAELVGRTRALILEDHPAISVELSFIDALAANESEVHRAGIARQRRSDRAADPAAVA